jgi:hypothetical protein
MERRDEDNWPVYRICGFNVSSNFPFAGSLIRTDQTPDLRFVLGDAPTGVRSAVSLEPDYESELLSPSGEPALRIYRREQYDVLKLPGQEEIYVGAEDVCVAPGVQPQLFRIEHDFFSLLFPYYLERRGDTVLHASAVAREGKAAAFLGLPGAGKSTLAAFLTSRGWTCLSDDLLLAIPGDDVLVEPSHPNLRLWKSVVERLLGSVSGLPEVAPGTPKYIVPVETSGLGSYSDQSLRLHRIYLPIRTQKTEWNEAIRITEVPPLEAIIALVTHSMLPRIPHSLGWEKRRMPQLAEIARRVPFRRLAYTDGFDNLPTLEEALIRDLADISPLANAE